MRITVALAIALLAIPFTTPAPTAAAPPADPNVVVIMLDDHPFDTADSMLQRMPTLRSLFLDQGLRFEHYYGNDPLCCPGRANVLTGLYSHHHGVFVNNGTPFQPDETVATALHAAGYHTFITGKYLNGVHNFADMTPPGWDHTSISSGAYYDYVHLRDGVRRQRGTRPRDYSTDVFANDAVAFLEAAPAEQPVFAFLTPTSTHGGKDPSTGRAGSPVPAVRHQGDPACSDIGRYRPVGYNERDVSDKPTFIRTRSFVPYAKGWPLQRACESLLAVDEMVERVRDVLIEQGRYENTLFVLTADNGMSWGLHRWARKKVPWSTHLPLHVTWPGVTPQTLMTVDGWVSNIDLGPTLVEAGGADPLGPFPTGQAAPDGQSFFQLIVDGDGVLDRDALLEERRVGDEGAPGWCAVRTTGESPLGLWHFARWKDGQRELYDLEADPPSSRTSPASPASTPSRPSSWHGWPVSAKATWRAPWMAAWASPTDRRACDRRAGSGRGRGGGGGGAAGRGPRAGHPRPSRSRPARGALRRSRPIRRRQRRLRRGIP